MRRISHPVVRYALAIFIALAALYSRYLLNPLYGNQNAYHTVWLAVALSSWFLGLGPSIVATLISVIGVWYLFTPLLHVSPLQDRVDIFGALGFLLFSSAIIAMGEANRRGNASQFRLAAIVGSSDDAIVSKDLNGIIASWNKGAEKLFGWKASDAVGRSVTILIPPELLHEETKILESLRAGRRIEGYETVRVRKDGTRVDVSLTVSPIKDSTGRVIGASKIARDISERKLAEAKLRAVHEELENRVKERTAELLQKNFELMNQAVVVQELSARLLKLQDEERRRIARELHDSVGQLSAVMSMNLSEVAQEKEKLNPAAEKCLDHTVRLIDQVSREIRTLSHLLHPPLLDEVGLSSALKWFLDGFSERSKIDVSLDIPQDFERLPSDAEISIFRVVQECLTNIHRHSGSSRAAIHLIQNDGHVQLEVKDNGKGIPPEKQLELNSSGAFGVGFRGMRERLRQMGGTLRVDSNSSEQQSRPHCVSQTRSHRKLTEVPARF